MRIDRSRLFLTDLKAAVLVLGGAAAGCSSTQPSYRSEAYRPAGSWISTNEYAGRRERLMERIQGGVAIIPGATAPVDSGQFRQNNDFFYFTGVEIPGAFLVVDSVAEESTLFFTLTEHEARAEGIPLELVHDPVAATGIERVRTFEEFAPQLAELHARTPIFYTPHFPQELPRVSSLEGFAAWNHTIAENPWDGRPTRQQRFIERLRETLPGVEVRDCSLLIWQLRKFKSEAEIALIRRAARIAVDGHRALIRSTEPGISEQELAALFRFICQKEGAQDLAYPTILMTGPNHPFGHYHRYDRVLQDGDFLILDAGPDYAYYDADVSSSYPVSGTFTPLQRNLYELAEAIHQVCLAGYRPGRTFRDVGRDVAAYLTENGLDPLERRFRGVTMWGGYNHPIGMATHDVMKSMSGPDDLLEPGFVFACDINMPQDEEFGIRIEDTVVITADGCEVLSAGLPRAVAEIEALMKEQGLLQRMER